VYTSSFRYERAYSLSEASAQLVALGEDAKALAGGQSMIPLMKLRLSRPSALVDLTFIPGLAEIKKRGDTLHIGALASHMAIAESDTAYEIPILHDCAAGIADVQVRNRGTIGGSVAEADPTGDWAAVLMTLQTQIHSAGPDGTRSMPLSQFLKDAFTTELAHGELVSEITVKIPPKHSGGAYVAFKRCAPVYASATSAVQITMGDADTCKEAHIYLGCIGLLPVHAEEAEKELAGKKITPKIIASAAEAAMHAGDPQSDMRGSAEYKRVLVKSLTRRAIEAAVRRCRGERVEVGHEYIGR
jgi:aerobic carbon-monoxide dehydrogenase medium subunit